MSGNAELERPVDGVRTPHETAPGVLFGPAAGPDPEAPIHMSAPLSTWEGRFRRMVMASDASSMLLGVVVTVVVAGLGEFSAFRAVIAVTAVALALCCLASTRVWDGAVLGQGSEEFSRIIRAMTTTAVVLALFSLAFTVLEVRPWVFVFAPAATVVMLLGRYVARKALHRRRRAGVCLRPMLAIGSVDAVGEIIRRTRRDLYNGWRVTGVCTPTGAGDEHSAHVADVPVVGDLDAAAALVRGGEYRAVAVSSAPGWTARRLHTLAWDLEETHAELMVDPGVMDVAGPRLHIAAIDGFPLLRLTKPAFSGVPRVVKGVGDILGAATLVMILSPLLLALAVAIKAGGGPVLYRQSRIGRHGRSFTMIKFRSMVVGAHECLPALALSNEGSGPLFKIRNDPRVTRVGAIMRRYSLDELPQLFNVLGTTMSLVGPRPPLPSEVTTYDRDARRKLLVKPGMTGLWQISGRSDLSWDESVRLDLRYVENWSLAEDALILWKTVAAVSRRTGAY